LIIHPEEVNRMKVKSQLKSGFDLEDYVDG